MNPKPKRRAGRKKSLLDRLWQYAFTFEYYYDAYGGDKPWFPKDRPSHDDCLKWLQEGARLMAEAYGEIRRLPTAKGRGK